MKPNPPCGRKCPKRSAVPNCHDPAVCGDWAAYQAALAKWNEEWKAEKKARADIRATKKRVLSINREKETDKI